MNSGEFAGVYIVTPKQMNSKKSSLYFSIFNDVVNPEGCLATSDCGIPFAICFGRKLCWLLVL